MLPGQLPVSARRLSMLGGQAAMVTSVLLSSWAAICQPGLTSRLSGDGADTNPVHFWIRFSNILPTLPSAGRPRPPREVDLMPASCQRSQA